MSRDKLNYFVLGAMIVIKLTFSAKTEDLPPQFDENPSKQITEVESVLGTTTKGRADINFRLPNNTEPIHYNIEITTNIHNGTRDITGVVQILLRSTEDTRTIVLHALQLEDFQAKIISADQPNVKEYTMSWAYESERQFLMLSPQDTDVNFNKGSNWILTITYKGKINTVGEGLYLVSYTDNLNNIHYMAVTQFEPTYARMTFPCYDEPAKRATFTATIKHHPSYNALSNMPKNESASSKGVTVFDKTNLTVPTYLIAFHISDYEWSEGVLHSLPHRLYSKPESVSIQEYALVSGLIILQRLADYYNVAFPLPRMVQLAIPKKGGATENWGLVTYDEKYLLFNKSISTTTSQIATQNVIGHEFAHQWFGNYVAVKWWTYLWLKEGFATIYSYEVVDEIYPEWGVYQMLHTAEYQSALITEGKGSLVPMTHYAQTPSEITARYDASSYAKPACVIYMWQNALGDKVFRSSLNKYLTNNALSSADEFQLFAAMQNAVEEHKVSIPARINVMFPTWSQQSGYPLLKVTRNYVSKTFTVTQTAYNDNKSISSSKTYYVPFNYASTSKTDFRNTKATHFLSNTKEITIEASEVGANDWLILNKQSTGYYRINYDDENWNLITKGLLSRPNIIHPRNRAQLMYDAYMFVITERLPHNILMELLTYLSGEDQYAPWQAANSIITTFNTYLSCDNDYENLKQFIASLISNIYNTLGVHESAGEQLLRKLTRNTAVNLACLIGMENCIKDASDKLKALINNGVPIEPNLKPQAYCNGLRRSSDNDYNYFFNDFLKSSDTSYRSYLLSALGCSENGEHLRKFVSNSINLSNTLKSSDRTSILSNVYKKSALGLLVSIDFLSTNWEAYGSLSRDTGNSNPLNKDIVQMAQYVTTNDQQKKILALVNKVKDSNIVESELEYKVKANIKKNFDWLDKHRRPIMSFVKHYRRSDSTRLSSSLLSIFIALFLTLSIFL